MDDLTDNPYASPESTAWVARRSRFPAFVTGLIGLAMGAGFYGMLCAFLLVAYFVAAPGMPSPRERAFMIGTAVFHSVPLTIWVFQRRRLYRLSLPLLWVLAIGCWLLMPLSGAFMILNLGL